MAFQYCLGLINVDFSNGSSTLTLDGGLFYGSNSIQTVHYGRNLAGSTAPFQDKTALTTVTSNDNDIRSIPDYSFSGCISLNNVTLPNSINSIGSYSFNNCSNLKTITIPNGVTEIGNIAFGGCGLTSITIPENVIAIGQEAFRYCANLTDVNFSNGSRTLTLASVMSTLT